MEALKRIWCEWTHGGGTIERDHEGRINWRCSRCGRWSDHPVPKHTETSVIDRELSAYRKKQEGA